MESIDQMHVSHSKMATVVDYDMSANEFLAGLPPQVCPPALLFRLGSRKVRRYKNTWIRNSSDAMAAQQWKVVRRRRSSEGCNMSASPMARAATQGQDIPTRRVVITSEEDMPADSWLPNDLLLHKMANKSDRAQTTPPPLGEQSLGRRLEAQKSFTRGHFW